MYILNKLNAKLNGNKKWLISGIIIILLLTALIGWQREEVWKIITTFIGSSEKAYLYFEPSYGTFEMNEEFKLKVSVYPRNNNLVAVAAYISYDPAVFEIINIDTSQSPFTANNNCQYQGKACEIISHNASAGKIEIIKAKPSPGVNNAYALLATLTLKAKKEAASSIISFEFSGPYQGKSRAILDDGQGTDVLSAINNSEYRIIKQPIVIIPAAPTAFYSSDVFRDKLTLHWTDNSNNEDGFYIFRNASQVKPLNFYKSNSANDDSFLDENLVCNTNYYYWVEAFNSSGKSTDVSLNVKTAACLLEPYNPDLNNDGKVGSTDAAKYVQLWHQKSLLADVNKDGLITATDATKYVQFWHQAQAQ